MTESRKRRSHVLEYLQKQQEAREAEDTVSGGDQPFPALRAELGLGGTTGDGEK